MKWPARSFDPRPIVEHIYEITHRPVLVAEFAFRAENAGLPNTQGAGPKVPDQMARARAYENYVTELEGMPAAVGYQWFEWCDEPKQGRFDGENSNYGLVNIEDQPYSQFVNEVTAANRKAIAVHRGLMESFPPKNGSARKLTLASPIELRPKETSAPIVRIFNVSRSCAR